MILKKQKFKIKLQKSIIGNLHNLRKILMSKYLYHNGHTYHINKNFLCYFSSKFPQTYSS